MDVILTIKAALLNQYSENYIVYICIYIYTPCTQKLNMSSYPIVANNSLSPGLFILPYVTVSNPQHSDMGTKFGLLILDQNIVVFHDLAESDSRTHTRVGYEFPSPGNKGCHYCCKFVTSHNIYYSSSHIFLNSEKDDISSNTLPLASCYLNIPTLLHLAPSRNDANSSTPFP